MPKLTRFLHVGIPVSDMDRSIKFYSEVIGCTLLMRDPTTSFLDAAGTCVVLCKEVSPIAPPDRLDIVHHAFAIEPSEYEAIGAHLAHYGIEILSTEDRQNGVLNGPRCYFRDPDGTKLEFISLTSYVTTPLSQVQTRGDR